jgi:hypothetical protein
MKNIIKKILKESTDKKPYLFSDGGYLLPSDNGSIFLTDSEFNRLKKINDSCKEMYQLNKEKLDLISQHNKGVLQKIIKDINNPTLTNEITSKIPFDDEIKYELERYLEDTIWSRVGRVKERSEELIHLHNKFISKAKDKMSANEIAKRLFDYEKNILNKKS